MEAWIGGQRSSDDTWKYINGTAFSKTVTEYADETLQNCLFVILCKASSSGYSFTSDNCDERFSNSGLFCQYDRNQTSSCNSSDFSYGDKCYVKTSYNGKNKRIDWFNGQTYCNNNNIQVVIVYSYLDDDTITDSIINLVEDSAERKRGEHPRQSHHVECDEVELGSDSVTNTDKAIIVSVIQKEAPSGDL
ncbi:hypothetical protein LSH36_51g07031 [Paralvinella palmiformis]|uniref:C-type lectin domain-containing protein n=1 Tax=Paralvinella palmiformis TaxID=53620 RepID=A0AAD9K5L8_9ANNE|nr:hypothetical protein LSH36_51g07031 [Paralvinella palmiformis]